MSDELGSEARALMARALGDERPPERHELERIRRNVTLGVASSSILLTAEAVAAGKTSFLALVGLAAKGALVGTVVAVAAHTVQEIASDTASPAPAAALRAPASPPVEQLAHLALAAPAPAPAVTSSAVAKRDVGAPEAPGRTPPRVPNAAAPAELSFSVEALPDSAALREEVQQLRRVQEHLRAGQGAEALRELDASATRLGQGQLRQERLAAEVLAACQAGELARARRAARRFLQENPATPSAARLKTSCVAGGARPPVNDRFTQSPLERPLI